ncbi:hypothetical protein LTS10_000656 [Elasticomyces elasticus]|nr:hypothetical protein LTS10_000656 [Elasticomyces elasticus]
MPPPSTEDKFPPCHAFDTLIDVVVGEGDAQKTFNAYKGVLSFYSSFFDASLNGQFLEAREGIIKLPTEDPAIVEIFVHWTNTRRFCEDDKDSMEVMSYDTLARLWVFGDAHEIPLCQNAVCNILALKLYQAKDLPMRRVAGLTTETVDYIIMNSPLHQATLQEMLNDALWISYNFIKWADDMKLDEYTTRVFGASRTGARATWIPDLAKWLMGPFLRSPGVQVACPSRMRQLPSIVRRERRKLMVGEDDRASTEDGTENDEESNNASKGWSGVESNVKGDVRLDTRG